MYYNRTIEKTLKNLVGQFPCITLYGARQVGKSTTLAYIFGDEIPVVTLDDVAVRDFARSNPKEFLQSYDWPLIIDEIQKAPELLNEIKIIIDREKLEVLRSGKPLPLMYLLTGSSQFELRTAVAETLAGRTAILEMSSLTLKERRLWESSRFFPDVSALRNIERNGNRQHLARSEVFREIFMGGMPDVVSGLTERNNYFKSYIANFLDKDIKNLITSASEGQFIAFVSYIAARTAQQLNVEDIARNIGINSRTVKRWLTILECSGLIVLLQPYMPNLSGRIIKSPKLYFMDTGLVAYLCKWPTSETLEQGAMSGAIFETFVVTEIIKDYLHNGLDPKRSLYYYRDKDKQEVDILVVDEKGIWPIEIKKGLGRPEATKNFHMLSKLGQPIMPGIVITTEDRIRPLNCEAWVIPLELI